MAFFDTLKELAGTVVEAAKENPVAALAIGGGVVVLGGGGYYAKKKLGERAGAKQVAAQPAPAALAGISPVAAVAEDAGLTGEQFQHPERPEDKPANGSAKAVI